MDFSDHALLELVALGRTTKIHEMILNETRHLGFAGVQQMHCQYSWTQALDWEGTKEMQISFLDFKMFLGKNKIQVLFHLILHDIKMKIKTMWNVHITAS